MKDLKRSVDRIGAVSVLSNPGGPVSGFVPVRTVELIGSCIDFVGVCPHGCGGLPTFKLVAEHLSVAFVRELRERFLLYFLPSGLPSLCASRLFLTDQSASASAISSLWISVGNFSSSDDRGSHIRTESFGLPKSW